MGFTNFPNGITSFGAPVFGGGNMAPIFGNMYKVDGTNGSDDNSGKMDSPKKTIQAAVTLQIAERTGLGDVIWVMPGTYAESITGDLTQCKLMGYHPFAVRVTPSASHAYS